VGANDLLNPLNTCACRFVVLLAEQRDYFFILYIINFVAEGWLALLALLYYPGEDNLEPIPDDPNNPVIYQVRSQLFSCFSIIGRPMQALSR